MLLATTSAAVPLTLSVRSFAGDTGSTAATVPGQGAIQAYVSAGAPFDFPADRYGDVKADSASGGQVIGEVLRLRRAVIDGRRRIDYVMPTVIR